MMAIAASTKICRSTDRVNRWSIIAMAMPMNVPKRKGPAIWIIVVKTDAVADRALFFRKMKPIMATKLLMPISGRIVSVREPSDWYSRITICVAAGAVVMDITARKAAASGEAPVPKVPSPTRIAVIPISTALMREAFGAYFSNRFQAEAAADSEDNQPENDIMQRNKRMNLLRPNHAREGPG